MTYFTAFPPEHIFHGLTPYDAEAVSLDPPWRFKARSDKGLGRSPDQHYKTESNEWIARLPIRELVNPRRCHLFLWIPAAHLAKGHHLPILQAWHFEPSSIAHVWVKLKRGHETGAPIRGEADVHMGLGLTTRKGAEYVVLARRGNPRRISREILDVIFSPVREHSRKPDEFYSRVRQYCRGPYLALFEREQREGWTCWGDELDKFGAVAA